MASMGWFSVRLFNGFKWEPIALENAFITTFTFTIIKFFRGICHADTPKDIKTGMSIYLSIEFVLLLLFLAPSQFLDRQWEWSNDVRVALVVGYLLLRKILFLTPFCCGCRNVWCCDMGCEQAESKAGGVFAAAKSVRRVAGWLWNFRHASGFMQERFSLIVLIAIGEFFFFLAQFLNMVSNFGGSAALLHALGLFIGYSIWWTYFDNMNLAVLDNSHHHLMVVWAHLNLCMYVCV